MPDLNSTERRALALVAQGSVGVGLTKYRNLRDHGFVEIRQAGFNGRRYFITARGIEEHARQLAAPLKSTPKN